MDEASFTITILTVLGSMFVFYHKVKKEIVNDEKDKNEPIIELNESIIKLTDQIGFLNEMINLLKERVSSHGKEIDSLKLQNERQDQRISHLEKHYDNKSKEE